MLPYMYNNRGWYGVQYGMSTVPLLLCGLAMKGLVSHLQRLESMPLDSTYLPLGLTLNPVTVSL